MAELLADPRVKWVERDQPLRTLEVVPDDLNRNQWGLRSSGGFDVRASAAWRLTTGSKSVVVAVIDTGVDLRNPDFVPNLWVNAAEAAGRSGVDDDGNGFVDDVHGYDFAFNHGNPQDTRGHGSHVAGIIGATGNNGVGLTGVSWNVSLMVLNMFPRYSDARTSDAIRSIDYAVANGAKIINASWGQSAEFNDGEGLLLMQAIERANAAGVLFVAAAGNNRSDTDRVPMRPATMPVDNIVSVGSITRTGEMSRFTNFGATTVDVFAPGSDILSHTPSGEDYKSGTSMAAPFVTGIAALMLAHAPTLTVPELKTRLIGSCRVNPRLTGKCVCGGQVDAERALSLN